MSATDIWISIVIFALIFAVFAVVDGVLMVRYGRRPLGDDPLARITSPDQPGQPGRPGSPGASRGSGDPGELDIPSAQAESSVEDESVLIY